MKGKSKSPSALRILAVSDVSSRGLENLVVHSPGKLKNLDMIISCGDLGRDYLEFLADGLKRSFFFVRGNHCVECESVDAGSDLWNKVCRSKDKKKCFIAGSEDVHGSVEIFKDYLIAGFGGSLWYGGRGNEYREREMAKVVRRVVRKIRWHRLKDFLARCKPRKVIVISHAPLFHIHDQSDLCHTGFKCFHNLIKKISPLLWLHGHIHVPDIHSNKITVIGETTVANVFCYKYIKIKNDKVKISFKHDILDT